MVSDLKSPWSPRLFGQLGLLGILAFLTSLSVLHLMTPGFDWTRQYVSDMANEPSGFLFVGGTFVHSWGNLSLAFGLRAALKPGSLRTWGVSLFSLTALGILLAALYPVDVPGHIPTLAGRIHRSSASAGFLLEIAALFVFTAAFDRHPRWQQYRSVSMLLSVVAAIAVAAFAMGVQSGFVPGVFERFALVVLLAWEIWVALILIRNFPTSPT